MSDNQCNGITSKGERCKLKKKPDTDYCRLHSEPKGSNEEKHDNDTPRSFNSEKCESLTEKGKRCNRFAVENRKCDMHNKRDKYQSDEPPSLEKCESLTEKGKRCNRFAVENRKCDMHNKRDKYQSDEPPSLEKCESLTEKGKRCNRFAVENRKCDMHNVKEREDSKGCNEVNDGERCNRNIYENISGLCGRANCTFNDCTKIKYVVDKCSIHVNTDRSRCSFTFPNLKRCTNNKDHGSVLCKSHNENKPTSCSGLFNNLSCPSINVDIYGFCKHHSTKCSISGCKLSSVYESDKCELHRLEDLRCTAVNTFGIRCSNSSMDNDILCSVHGEMERSYKENLKNRCKFKLYSGAYCMSNKKEEEKYCKSHMKLKRECKYKYVNNSTCCNEKEDEDEYCKFHIEWEKYGDSQRTTEKEEHLKREKDAQKRKEEAEKRKDEARKKNEETRKRKEEAEKRKEEYKKKFEENQKKWEEYEKSEYQCSYVKFGIRCNQGCITGSQLCQMHYDVDKSSTGCTFVMLNGSKCPSQSITTSRYCAYHTVNNNCNRENNTKTTFKFDSLKHTVKFNNLNEIDKAEIVMAINSFKMKNEDMDSRSVRRIYKMYAMKNHPDKGGDEEMFKLLGKYKEILSNFFDS